jgi:hypothetical protein
MLDDYAACVLEGAAWVLEEGAAIVGIIVLLPTTNYLLLHNVPSLLADTPALASCQAPQIGRPRRYRRPLRHSRASAAEGPALPAG